MKNFVKASLFLTSLLALSAHATVPSSEILKQSPKVLSAQTYQAEPYATLPAETLGKLDEATYAGCSDRLAKSKIQFFNVTYLSDGLKVKAIVGLPKDFNPAQKYPVVVYNRGGNREFGRVISCTLMMVNNLFGNGGRNLIFAPQYRGNAGGEGKEEFGGKDLDDVSNLIAMAREMNFSDSNNIFLSGWSRGGMMTYLELKAQVSINSAIVIAGPTELVRDLAANPGMKGVYKDLIPGFEAHPTESLQERSALFWSEKINSPLLIMQGNQDLNVNVNDSLELAKKLEDQRKEVKLVVYPGQDHSLWDVRLDMHDEIQAWIKNHLKN